MIFAWNPYIKIFGASHLILFSENNPHTPIPRLTRIWFPGKTAVCENHVSGTVLMFQLTQNSPTKTNSL